MVKLFFHKNLEIASEIISGFKPFVTELIWFDFELLLN